MQVVAEEPLVFRSPLTCLIVDDSAFMRFHLKRMMDSFENVIASEAANGAEAIREYGRLRPDIVLMDIVMPGIEGVETVKRICDSDPAAKVIMISSVSYRGKVEEAPSSRAAPRGSRSPVPTRRCQHSDASCRSR